MINYVIQRGEINKPEYEFAQRFDEDGNPEWECSADIRELGYVYYGYGSTKKEAQANMLLRLLKDLK